MKIAVVGSHGTGKSRIVKNIKLPKEFSKINEIARTIIEELNILPQDMSKDELIKFQKSIFEKQIEEEKKYKMFFTDRSLLDMVAYSEGLPIYEEMFKFTKEYIKKYDLFIYVPIMFPLKKDGIRYESDDFQLEVDKRIQKLLKNFGIKYYTIKSDNKEERLEEILNLPIIKNKIDSFKES